MRINTNLIALNTKNLLKKNSKATSNIMEKLASGKRINKAADDAAGLAISQKMRAQIRGLDQANENVQNGVSLIQTAEGALNEMEAMTQRMRELSVQGANDTLTTEDREKIQKELDTLKEQVDVIANTTEFNTKKLLNGEIQTEMKSVSQSLDLDIPLDGSTVSTSLDLEGETIALDFTDDLSGNTEVNIDESGDILANELLNKSNENVEIMWETPIGGSVNSITKTNDGGYIVSGRSIIKKFNENDVLEWSSYYNYENFTDIEQTSDNGYILTGFSSFNYSIRKIDSNGDTEWNKIYGGSLWDYSTSVIEDKDGNLLIFGISESSDGDHTTNHTSDGKSDMWLLKHDSEGNLLWKNSYGGSEDDRGLEIIEATDGGYILAGQTGSNDGDISSNKGLLDYSVIKIDQDGIVKWEQTYGGSSRDRLRNITATTDGGYILGGQAYSTNGDISEYVGKPNGWIVKINKEGDIQWEKSNPGGEVYDIKETNDKGFIISGTTGDPTYNYWLAKTDINGNLEWEEIYGSSHHEYGQSVIEYNLGEYLVAGSGKITKIDGPDEILNNIDKTINLDENLTNENITIENIELTFENNKYEKVNGIKANYSVKSEDNGLIIQTGANAGQQMKISINDMRSEELGMTDGYPKVITREDAEISIEISDKAIQKLSNERAKLGAKQNRLEHISKNLANTSENLKSAESRISDADIARQAMRLTKNDILIQASQAMLAQANNLPQGVLQLLK